MPINYKDYPDNWFSDIRPRILERAGHKCEQCRVQNYLVILRGHYHNQPIYMDAELTVYDAETSEILHVRPDDCDCPGSNKLVKVILTVAHLCHDSKCDNDEHLRALCQRCHLRLDINHHRDTRRRRRAAKRGQLDLFEFKTHSNGFSNIVNLKDNPQLFDHQARNDFEEAFKGAFGIMPFYVTEYNPELIYAHRCATVQESTGKHCIEKPIHNIGGGDWLCDGCFATWRLRTQPASGNGVPRFPPLKRDIDEEE